MAAAETTGYAFRATWRDKDGGLVSSSDPATFCRNPKMPWVLRAVREGYAHIIPCGECSGCLEFERRRLAGRLASKYQDSSRTTVKSGTTRGAIGTLAGAGATTGIELPRRRLAGRPCALYGDALSVTTKTQRDGDTACGASTRETPTRLWMIRVYAPLEEHAELAHLLHHRRGLKRWCKAHGLVYYRGLFDGLDKLELEPGYWRLGANSFALLSRSKQSPPLLLRALGLTVRVEPILLRRGRRAWRALTAGILLARELKDDEVSAKRAAYSLRHDVTKFHWPEHLDRWYCRGLPKAEREKWEVDRHAGQKGYSRAKSPRAWKGGRLVLVPPEAWGLGRADRRTLRRDLSAATDPEGVARVMGLVASLLAKQKVSSLIGPAGRPVLTSDQVKAWYAEMARRKAANAERERTDLSSLPSSEKGGYVSSGHSTETRPPPKLDTEYSHRDVPPLVTRHIPQIAEDSLTELTRKQWIKRRERRALDEHLEGLRKRIKERGQ